MSFLLVRAILQIIVPLHFASKPYTVDFSRHRRTKDHGDTNALSTTSHGATRIGNCVQPSDHVIFAFHSPSYLFQPTNDVHRINNTRDTSGLRRELIYGKQLLKKC